MAILRVPDRTVVALPEVLLDQLPVRADVVAPCTADSGLLELVRGEVCPDPLLNQAKVRRIIGKADEDERLDDPHRHRQKPELGPVEIRRHRRGGAQSTVLFVYPLMVR